MKAFLLFRDQDFDQQQPLPANETALTQDLGLNILFNAMAQGDQFLFDVAKKTILSGSEDTDTIEYRQDILKDCLNNPTVVRQIYQIPIESIENRRKHWLGVISHYPSGILYEAIEMMQMFVGLLQKLKYISAEYGSRFESEGFTSFFSMINKELDDEYFAEVQNHLVELKFNDGVLLSAELGRGNEGTNYVLRKPPIKQSRMKLIFSKQKQIYTFSIHPRDDHGARAISELKDRVINLAANALAQSAEHIDSFLKMLRIEMAFYIGCLNLYEQLAQMGETISFPKLAPANERRHSFRGLYDISLALTLKHKTVGNDMAADDKDLFIITGANQGGKSTFLRSIGLAQLLLQCGMFVPADSFHANICTGIYTHYKRKEDASMKSGKLDEELSRMSDIVDQISPDSIILFNESFSATNEREGSEIARQITSALIARRIKVFFVTHQYEFAHGFYDKQRDNVIFLRAERKHGGGRTYKLFEGEPMQTSYGKDLYTSIIQPATR